METKIERLMIDLIEVWNDSNPTEILSPEILGIIERYLNYSAVIGMNYAASDIRLRLVNLPANKSLIFEYLENTYQAH